MPVLTPFRRLIVASLLYMGAFAALRVVVSYRALAVGADAVAIGIIAAAFSFLPLLLAFPMGRLADSRGARPLLVWALLISAAATMAAAVSDSVVLIGVANALLGLGQLLAIIGGQSMVMELLGRDQYVKGFAGFTLAVSIGQTIATPAIGVLLGDESAATVDTWPSFVACAVAFVIALPLALSLPRLLGPAAGSEPNGAAADRTGFVEMMRMPGMLPATYSSLVVLSSIELVAAYMPLIGESAGLSAVTVSLLVTLRSLTAVISRAFMPLLLRRTTQTRLLILSPVICTPALVGLGLAQSVWLLALCLAVLGFWWGLNQPLTMNWIAQIAPAGERSAAMSLRLLGNRVGQVVVPLAAGGIAGGLGPGSVFLLAAALTGASVASTTRGLRSAPPE